MIVVNKLYLPLIVLLTLAACSESSVSSVTTPTPTLPGGENRTCSFDGSWLIPRENVFDGGPGCDGIPALEALSFVSVEQATYLSANDLVLVADDGGTDVVVYPHAILDWHEIINDEANGQPLAIVYCPLTGTGIGWDRRFDGETTTFGVSGLLYNTNIIPYDRSTGSNWSQQRMQCVNGTRSGERPVTTNLLEMRWSDVQRLFPAAKVVSDNTGFARNYQRYPYGGYRTDDNLIFPLENEDTRLPRKERVMGVLVNNNVKTYRFDAFAPSGWSLLEDRFGDRDLVLIGSQLPEAILAFDRQLADGTVLDFTLDTTGDLPELVDQEGNRWNLFGRALSGPRVGQQLPAPAAMIGYWFSWGAFYPGVVLYE